MATPQLLNFKAFDAWTGGVQGLQLGKPHAPFGLPLTPDQWLYFLCLACAAPLFWAAANLLRGRIGRAIVAIRDHPIAAEAMGINTSFYKAMCFGVSALYAGVAGALGAIVVGFVSPDSFGFFCSLSFLVGIVVGGLASIGGVVFGALFIEFVPNYADRLSDLFGESAKALPGAIYGVLLIALMAAMPTGVAGALGSATSLILRLFSRAQARLDWSVDSRPAAATKNPSRKRPARARHNRRKTHDFASQFLAGWRRFGRRPRPRFAVRHRRQCAGDHRRRNQDRPDHAL